MQVHQTKYNEFYLDKTPDSVTIDYLDEINDLFRTNVTTMLYKFTLNTFYTIHIHTHHTSHSDSKIGIYKLIDEKVFNFIS